MFQFSPVDDYCVLNSCGVFKLIFLPYTWAIFITQPPIIVRRASNLIIGNSLILTKIWLLSFMYVQNIAPCA